jgi:hypothetical protein
MLNLADKAVTMMFEAAAMLPAVIVSAFILLGPPVTICVALFQKFGGHHG